MITTMFAAVLLSQTLVPVDAYVPVVGDNVLLYARERGKLLPVVVAVDYLAGLDLAQAMHAADLKGVEKLLTAKRCVLLDSGTEVKIIADCIAIEDPMKRGCEVRVRQGALKDKAVWVDKLFLKKCTVVYPRKKK